MLKFMINVKSPYDVLEENQKTKQILRKYEEINSKYQTLMKKARNDFLAFFNFLQKCKISLRELYSKLQPLAL